MMIQLNLHIINRGNKSQLTARFVHWYLNKISKLCFYREMAGWAGPFRSTLVLFHWRWRLWGSTLHPAMTMWKPSMGVSTYQITITPARRIKGFLVEPRLAVTWNILSACCQVLPLAALRFESSLDLLRLTYALYYVVCASIAWLFNISALC